MEIAILPIEQVIINGKNHKKKERDLESTIVPRPTMYWYVSMCDRPIEWLINLDGFKWR